MIYTTFILDWTRAFVRAWVVREGLLQYEPGLRCADPIQWIGGAKGVDLRGSEHHSGH